MWLFHLRRQDQTSCLFLLLAEKSFFPLPTPENHCLELLVVQLPIAVQVASLARRRREVQLFGRKGKKCSSFAISASVGGRSQLPPHHQRALQSTPPFVPYSADHSLHIEDHLRSIRGNALSQPSLQERLRLPAIHLWIAERKVPTSKTKSIVFQLTSSEVVIHRNSFLSINPSKLTSNNLRNIYDLSFWH